MFSKYNLEDASSKTSFDRKPFLETLKYSLRTKANRSLQHKWGATIKLLREKRVILKNYLPLSHHRLTLLMTVFKATVTVGSTYYKRKPERTTLPLYRLLNHQLKLQSHFLHLSSSDIKNSWKFYKLVENETSDCNLVKFTGCRNGEFKAQAANAVAFRKMVTLLKKNELCRPYLPTKDWACLPGGPKGIALNNPNWLYHWQPLNGRSHCEKRP